MCSVHACVTELRLLSLGPHRPAGARGFVCLHTARHPRQPHASAAHGGLQTWLPETAKTLESLLLTTERPLGPPSRTSQFPPGLEAASEQVPTLLTSRWLPIHHSPGHPAPPAFGLDLQTSGRASLLLEAGGRPLQWEQKAFEASSALAQRGQRRARPRIHSTDMSMNPPIRTSA